MLIDTEKKLLARGTELYAHKGEFLYRREQPAEYVFYLKDGSVEIVSDSANVRLQGCRCFLGLHEALLNDHHRSSVKVNDESILLVFEKQQIETFLEESPHARRYLMLQICDQLALMKRDYE